MSLPYERAGRHRLTLEIVVGDFEANWLPEYRFERGHVAVCGPQFELRVAGGAQAREVIVAARVEVHARQCLRVAAVETFG
jgi:hypothetical protein